jgi:hypothetical protein
MEGESLSSRKCIFEGFASLSIAITTTTYNMDYGRCWNTGHVAWDLG